MKNEIILYSPDELAEHIEVRIDEKATVAKFATVLNKGGRIVELVTNCDRFESMKFTTQLWK